MYLVLHGASICLLLAATLNMAVAKNPTPPVNPAEAKKTADSPINHIIKKAREISKDSLEKADQALIFKYQEKNIFMFCIGHSVEKKFYLMTITIKDKEPTLHLLFRADSCAEEMEQKVALSVNVITYDTDLVALTLLARVKNEGCFRYTTIDHKLMSIDCPDVDPDHGWIRLHPEESKKTLEQVAEKAKECPIEPEDSGENSDGVVQEKKGHTRKRRNAGFGFAGMTFAVDLNRFS